MTGFAEVRALSRQPPWRLWALAAILGRLLSTMVVLAYVLVGEAVYDSIALGALLAGTATFSAGLAAPVLGRRLDRRGIRAGLVASLWITTAVLTAQLFVVTSAGPRWALFGLAALQGVSYAPVPGAYRALLVPSVSARDLPRANTVDAVLTEVGFVAGPAVAGMAAAVFGPLGVMTLMAAVVILAAVVTARLPRVEPAPPGAVSPWRRPSARMVYAVCFAVGAAIGLLESAIAARVLDIGYPAPLAGPLLALVAVGSGAAGFLVSTLSDQRGRFLLRAVSALGAFSVALALAALASNIVLLGLAMVLVGVPIAPLNAMGSQRLQDTLEVRQLGEGFALYTALILIGVGSGDLLTGRLLDPIGAVALLLVAAAVPLAVVIIIGIRLLMSRPPATEPERSAGRQRLT